jgi:hypothetical protein
MKSENEEGLCGMGPPKKVPSKKRMRKTKCKGPEAEKMSGN